MFFTLAPLTNATAALSSLYSNRDRVSFSVGFSFSFLSIFNVRYDYIFDIVKSLKKMIEIIILRSATENAMVYICLFQLFPRTSKSSYLKMKKTFKSPKIYFIAAVLY